MCIHCVRSFVSAKIQDMAAVVHGDQDVIANHWYVIPRWPSAILFILFHQWLVRGIRLSPTTSLRELWEHLFSQKALPSSVLTLSPTAIRWSVTWTIDRGPKKVVRDPIWAPDPGANMGVSESSVPLNPMVLLIIIPIKWLFHWEYTLFSDNMWNRSPKGWNGHRLARPKNSVRSP